MIRCILPILEDTVALPPPPVPSRMVVLLVVDRPPGRTMVELPGRGDGEAGLDGVLTTGQPPAPEIVPPVVRSTHLLGRAHQFFMPILAQQEEGKMGKGRRSISPYPFYGGLDVEKSRLKTHHP